MPKWKISGFGSGLLTFLIGAVGSIGPAGAQVAGTVGAVNQDATGAPPGGGARPLNVGNSVVQNEHIRTDANGTAHIMFNDRSALNVGRNSNVVIDKFVYQPNAGAGNQAISLTRGAMRFVGGQISHGSETTVKTPAASIGVRGGNVTIVLEGHDEVVVMVHNGVAIVTNEFGSLTVRTGFQLIVQRGAPLGQPTRISLERLREATRRLASIGRQTGGAHRLPTESDAARNEIGSRRAPTQTPSFDLPAAGDNIARGKAMTEDGRPRNIYRP
jgi:hypothetical protein